MKRTLAIALTIGVLLTGCNRAKAAAPQPATTTPAKTQSTTVNTPATADVDGLLDEIDAQLKADSQKAPDED